MITLTAGVDEVGRGCLAGPVIAAAVILKDKIANLDDSKKLNQKKREELSSKILKNSYFSFGSASPKEIDEINILNASFLAMHRAIEGVNTKAELLLIDGNRFNPYPEIPHECIIKGDGKYLSIAAASVLAKTYRDDIMKELDTRFPAYNWKQNKGYPTKQHRKAIAEFGANNHHRKSFQLLPTQLVLNI